MEISPIDAVRAWVDRVVIGLDLCPFARVPFAADQVRFRLCSETEAADILADLMDEWTTLDGPRAEEQTSLLVIPALADFGVFLDLVSAAEALLKQTGADARWQLAHFHPDYRFEDTAEDDPANHSNRAPHPALHLLHIDAVAEAVQTHPDVGHIPRRNQALLRGLGVSALPSLSGPRATDFRAAFSQVPCWDKSTQAIFEREGEAKQDAALQNREELIALAEFIETHLIRSYLEIGVWTGQLVSALHRVFDFDKVGAADQGSAKQCGFKIHLPHDATVFWGDSQSAEFEHWRAALGHVDLVFIDGDHRFEGVKRDFEINRAHPHRFLAFHDITGSNRGTNGVQRFWEELDLGTKRTLLRPHAALEVDHSTMGIGIWSAKP